MTNAIENGLLAKAFPGEPISTEPKRFSLNHILSSKNISTRNKAKHRFEKSGMVVNRRVITSNFRSVYQGSHATISNVLENENCVPQNFYIEKSDIHKWHRKRNKIPVSSNAAENFTKRRNRPFPDPVDKPSRTILTEEGGHWPSWNTHVILTEEGNYRRLLPIELERLNMFPDNHTEGTADHHRAFLMGNALVIGIVERIGQELAIEHFAKTD